MSWARDPWGGAAYGSETVNRMTDWCYAGSATAVSGSWANPANAVGSATGDSAVLTLTGAGSGELELAGFGAAAAMGPGTPTSVAVRIRHSDPERIGAVSVQAYVGATPYGSAIPLLMTADREETLTITGLDAASLSDLRVRVSGTWSTAGYGVAAYGVGRYNL
jgi:hypothetical protein